MVCCPCQVARKKSEAEYGRRMMGAGNLYQERQWGQIQCNECGEEMALGFLVVHLQTQNGREAEERRHWEATAPGEELLTYRMAFLTARGLQNCPVEGCLGRATTRMAMRVHFPHRHVWNNVIVLE